MTLLYFEQTDKYKYAEHVFWLRQVTSRETEQNFPQPPTENV